MRRQSAGPIRQLSLQAEPPKPERRRPLVKQQSEDSSRLSVTAGPVRRSSPRPRPKLAWADRTESIQQRPLVVRGSARASSANPPRALPNANTELFARLRRSWRDHEHSRRNLNIFLAHAHAKVSSDSEDLFTPRSDDEDEDRTRVILKDRSNIKDEVIVFCSTDKPEKTQSPVPTVAPESSYAIAFSLSIQDEDAQITQSDKKIAIEIDVPRNLQSFTESNESKDELPPHLEILPNKFQSSTLTAAARRLNFKNSKTVSTPAVELPASVKTQPPILMRSSSLQVPSPCPTPTKGILKGRLQPAVSFEEVDKIVPVLPRAKSAPVRKKVKISQKKGRRCESPEEEGKEEEKEKTTNAKNGRRTQRTPSDVITMVSLLSPTTSSDEATEMEASPSEVESATEASDSVPITADQQPVGTPSQTWDGTPSEFRTFYLRKPAKCVSFQGNPSPSGSTLSATATAAVAAASLAASTAASPFLGYTFTEKRAPSFVPTTPEPQTAKRRLIRTPDLLLDLANPRDDPSDSEVESTPPCFCTTVANPDDQKGDKEESQPEFRTPKERECWALFRRMTEKGLPVSFDTVLRGLLTPTEYRLCRKNMLADC